MRQLPARSEPIGAKRATRRTAAIEPSGMKVRAVDGPYRNSWFHFYPDNDHKHTIRWPFGGKYQEEMVLTDRGTIHVYRLIQSDDVRKWKLEYDPIRSALAGD